MKIRKINNIFIKGTISLIIFILVTSSFLFLPQKVQAQFVVTDPLKLVKDIGNWIMENGGSLAYRNGLNFFLGEAAKQSAEYLASGGKGKKPSFLTDSKYWKKLGDQALGDFIATAGENLTGLDLCELDPKIKFDVLLTLDSANMTWKPENKCSFSDMKKNLEEALDGNLIDFSFSIEEGDISRQEGAISSLIQADDLLTEDIKKALDGVLNVCEMSGEDCTNAVESSIIVKIDGKSYYYGTEGEQGIGAILHKYTNELSKILEELTTSNLEYEERLKKAKAKAKEDKAAAKEAGIDYIEEPLPEMTPTSDLAAFAKLTEFQEKLNCEIDKGAGFLEENEIDSAGQELWVEKELGYYIYYNALCLDEGWKNAFINGDGPHVALRCRMFSDCNRADSFCNEDSTDELKKECFDRLKRIKKYIDKLEDWTIKLQEMVDKIITNWEKHKGIPDMGPLEDAENMFNPESNTAGIEMKLKNEALEKAFDAMEESKIFKTVEGAMNSAKTSISNIVKTPSTLVSEKARKSVSDGTASMTTTTEVAVVDALSVFVNTFLMKFVETQLFDKGLNKKVSSANSLPEDPNVIEATKVEFVVKTPTLNLSSDEMTIYDEIAVCPTGVDKKYRSTFNCLLDNNLTRAVEERMTIQEAIDAGFLNSDTKIGASLTDGELSHVNIKKLRRMSILPLGLEIASKIILEDSTYPNGLSLGEILDGFSQRGEDNTCGFDDPDGGESVFCNLVDPNWVLKASNYLCDLAGYSSVPIKDDFSRQNNCLDIKTCINETEDRQCDTWSYCTREKNIWRFSGDACYEQYSTCKTYTKDNKKVSYLSSTLDDKNCDSSNAGCKWYCSNWDQEYSGASGSWSCLSPGWRQYTCNLDGLCTEFLCFGGGSDGQPCTGPDNCPNGQCYRPNPNYTTAHLCNGGDNDGQRCIDGRDNCPGGQCNRPNPNYTTGVTTCTCSCDGINGCPGGLGSCLTVEGGMFCSLDRPELRNTIFFSDYIEDCKEMNNGCSQYIRTKPGLGVNFLVNGSFELPSQNDGSPLGWQVSDPAIIQQISLSSGAQHNSNVVQVQSSSGLKQIVDNVPLKGDFIASGYYKRNGDEIYGNPELILEICYNNDCSVFDAERQPIDLSENNWKYVSVSLSSQKDRYIDHINVWAFFDDGFQGDIYIDSMQLRNGTRNSAYRDYGSTGISHFKSAPEWMNCYDADYNNNIDCENFIQRCEPENVGCELYASISDNMSDVSALISDLDSCPSGCVGYETFEEMPTNFISNTSWVDLIPQTAQRCSAPGCEEFTNLDALNQGGEEREYYTYLRQCVKTDSQNLAVMDPSGANISPASADVCQYYYTWVGEETNGYQLKKYYLEANPSLGGPVQISETPSPEWGDCDGNNLDNPHCRQFYDAMGNIYYRLYKNTITCSQDCIPYRMIGDNDIKMAIKVEGETCSAQDVGCREYKGAAYGNMKNLFIDRFTGSSSPWEDVDISFESINHSGQSIRSENDSAARPVNGLSKGRIYSLSLWVKGSGGYSARFGDGTNPPIIYPRTVSVVSNEWQEIKFGSIYFNREPANEEILRVRGPETGFYLDNITLNEVQDNVYLIKNSWKTPSVCDIDLEGNSFPGYMLGCQAYRGRNNDILTLKSFSKLCPEEEVGCEAMIDTMNSTSPFREEFNIGSPQSDEVVIPEDAMVYFVNDPGKSCDIKDKGCQRFGLPDFDVDGNVMDFTDVYLLNNPDLYKTNSTLCDLLGEGCLEFESSDGPVWFKSSANNFCEYRENVMVASQRRSGWFKIGTSISCYTENEFPYQPYGSIYGIRSNKDPLYNGMLGICSEDQDGCTQFIDPVEQNLVLNSGLELDKNEDGIPDNWIISQDPESTISLEPTDCLSGSCWHVDRTEIENPAVPSYVRQDIAIQPGSTYQLSAWINVSDDSTGDNRIRLKYLNDSFQELDPNVTVFVDQPEPTDGKWIKISTTPLKAPYDAAFIRVYIAHWNNYINARIDNISLTEQHSSKGSYYYLDNDKLDRSSCEGMVGLKDGCILFNNVSSASSLSYDSASTYKESHSQNDISVNVKSINIASGANGNEGDSNIILRVDRDRVCGEWLTCSSDRSIWDSSIEDYRSTCDSWTRCDKLIGSGKGAQCGHVVFNSNPEFLSEQVYKKRNISWSGMDYSGYSIFNMYPIEMLFPIEKEKGHYVLTYKERVCVGGSNGGVGCNGNSDCYSGGICSDDSIERGVGILSPDGEPVNIEKTPYIYPEKNSPFKSMVEGTYNQVNLCDSGVDHGGGFDYTNDNYTEDDEKSLYPDCQGSYQKAEYGDKYSGIIKYFNFDIDIGGRKVCRSNGNFCEDDYDCNEITDDCIAPTKVTQVMGARGFCLEPDESKPSSIDSCITWWPGVGTGDLDIHTMQYSAGYIPNSNYHWYCMDQQQYIIDDVFDNVQQLGITEDNNKCWSKDQCHSSAIYDIKDSGRIFKESEIDYISTSLGASDGTSCSLDNVRYLAAEDRDLTDPFWMYTDCAQSSDYCSGCNGDLNNANETGCTPSGTCVGGDNDGDSCEDSDFCDPEGIYFCEYDYSVCFPCTSEAITTEGEWYGCVVSDGSYNGSCRTADNGGNGGWNCDCTQNSDGTANNGCSCTKIKVFFNDDGFLDTVQLKLIGKSASSDRQSWSGDLEVHLKNGCQYLVNVLPQNNSGLVIGYTDRLWDESIYYSENGGDRECGNYGAVGIQQSPNRLVIFNDSQNTCVEGQTNFMYLENQLMDLFVKIDAAQEFNQETSQYEPCSIDALWNQTNNLAYGSGPEYSPKIASVNEVQNKITINEFDTGYIGPVISPSVISLKFYAWADKDHMPIREIGIDWLGDLTSDSMTQSYNVINKNHRPECDETDFGSSSQACIEKNFLLNNTYSCEGEGSLGWEKYECDDMCCFKPKVYIKDNWGWCAGGVYVGCSDNCLSSGIGAGGVSYDGLIKVIPSY